MFGLLRPCAHGAKKYGIAAEQWQSHMCGLCLGLRDGYGQAARASTNTDAIVLNMLTEAQLTTGAARTTAGPCPLRGMRTASVASANSPGVRLAATASLLLASAKMRDHVIDGEAPMGAARPMSAMAGRWADHARTGAADIGLDLDPLVSALSSQSALEDSADSKGAVDEELSRLTEPTQLCTAEFFAHTARLAHRPENVDALRSAGWEFGRIAHLADAVADHDRDRQRGRFNPLVATGTELPQAYELMRQSNSRLHSAIAEARLADVPVVRWMLLDPLTAVLHRVGHGVGVLAASCSMSGGPTREDERRYAGGPGIGTAIGRIGIYGSGLACCVDHNTPCRGRRKKAWYKRCDGDCCECCCCDCDCG